MMNGDNRENEYLQNFKKMLNDMIFLLRTSFQAETVSMHWINSNREQLVLENYATNQKNVVFQDRVARKSHFLGKYEAIKSVTRLEVGAHIAPEELQHYTSAASVQYIYLIPFMYNSETVAITVVESSEKSQLTETDEAAISAYKNVLQKLLQTYLELSDLSEKQTQWSEYDEIAGNLTRTRSAFDLARLLLDDLQQFAGDSGGAVLLARGMNDWHSVLYSDNAAYPPPVGLAMQENSISAQALSDGNPVYASHFNSNPKRISTHEPLCKGASLAVPIMHQQRRQLLALVYNENPLIFTEAAKHKITNLCRIAGLKIEAMIPGLDVHDDIFSSPMTSYQQELFSGSLETIQCHLDKGNGAMQTWAGVVCVGNIADLRTKHRLEELIDLQKQVLLHLRPQKIGLSGMLGGHSDYIYTFVLQSTDEAAFARWSENLMETFQDDIRFSSGIREPVNLHMGVARLASGTDHEELMKKAKMAMNEAVKNKQFLVEV